MPELTGPISGTHVLGGRVLAGPTSSGPVVGTLFGVGGEAVIRTVSAVGGPRGAGRATTTRSGFARLLKGAKPVEASELGQAVTSRTR